MIKLVAKKYINDKLVATFEFSSEKQLEIDIKVKILKAMGFQEIVTK